MSEMSDLFDSLDAGDLDEIAGKLNVTPKKAPEPIVEEAAPLREKNDRDVSGSKERKYVKFESLNEQVQELFDNSEIFPETIKPRPKPQPKAPQQKPRQSFVESAAKALSASAKNAPKYETKPLRESLSVEDRVKLLEQDVFTQMSQSTPNTLVAGIGASLDSGGGAVWLWDLEDVNIGAPVDGQYPTIANGASLVYKSASNQWEAVVQSGGAGGTIYTNAVFLVNEITDETMQANIQTLPQPDGDIETQENANQWFLKALKDIDARLGGDDGNTDIPGNLDMEDTDNVAAIRRFGATTPELNIQVGQAVASLNTTTSFLQGSTTSFVPLTVRPASAQTVGGTVDLLIVGKTNTDNSLTNVLTVSIDETQFLNKSTFVRPSGGGISGFNIQGTLEGNVATNSNLFYVDQAADATAGADAIKYYGAITHENDIVTKKYVDSSTGGSTAGVTKIVAGTNVSIEPEGGTGEVTINATGSGGSGGWATAGDTDLTGPCDIELDASNNALRFIGSGNANGMIRLKEIDDVVEFNAQADFNQGFHIATSKEITLDGGGVVLNMLDGQGSAFKIQDSGNNTWLVANTAGGDDFTFYKSIGNNNDATRCEFSAYEPPGGSHFYLQTTDADALDFIDKTTNEIYLRFNTNAKALQIADAAVELDVTGTTNTGNLETLRWDVQNGLGAYSSGDIYIADNDNDALDIRNEAGGNPHLRFTTTNNAEKTVFYYPIQTSNASLILGSDGTITTSQTATFNGGIVHDPNSNAAVDFGAYDGSSARSMVRFNRRLANTAGQVDLVVRGYREGENTVKDIFQVKNNNPANEGDEILYYGETDNDEFAIQTKKSVNALIGTGGGGISFTFKGTTDATATNPPTGAVAGDYYLNDTSGSIGSGWGPISGIAVALNQLVIYKADGNWATGGGAAAFLPLTGGTLTGATTFDDALTADGVVTLNAEATSTAGIVVDRLSEPNNILDVKLDGARTAQIIANGNASFASTTTTGTLTIANTGATNALIIKDGSTTTAQIFKGGAATFEGAVTAAAFKLGNNSLFTVATTGATTVTGLTCNGAATISTSLGVVGAFTANNTSTFKGGTVTVEATAPLSISSQATFNTYPALIKAGFTAGILGTGADCAIEGDLTIQDPNVGSFSGALIFKNAGGTQRAKLSEAGLTTEARVVFNGSQANQGIKAEGNAAKTLSFSVSNATGGSAADNTFNTSLKLAKNKVTFPRIGSGVGFVIEGIREDDADRDTTTAELLTVYRNTPGGTNADAINYYGRTAGADNIQTQSSVNQLILDGMAAADLNLLTGGTIKSTGGSASTSGNLAVQATGASTGGNLYIRDAFSVDKVILAQSGDITLGENLTYSSGTNRVKTIQAYHASDNAQLICQTKKGTDNPVNVFSALAAEFTVATTLRVAPDTSTGSNTFQVNTGGKITNKATDNTTLQWGTSRNAHLAFENASSDAAISKTGGKNSSGRDYNRMLFYCGNTSNGDLNGVKDPMLTLINSKNSDGSNTKIMMAPDGLRQEIDKDIATVGYVDTTSVTGTVTFSTTQSTDPDSGETVEQYTQSHVSVPAQLSLGGRDTDGDGFLLQGKTVAAPTNSSAKLLETSHTAADAAAKIEYFGNTTAGDTIQTLNSVHANAHTFTATNIFNNQPVSFEKGLQLTGNASTQDIKVQGVNNKGMNIKCTDNSGTLVTVAEFSNAENKFNTPLAITKLAPYNTTGTGIDEVLEINGASQYKNIYVTGSSSAGHSISFGMGETTNAIYTVLNLVHQSPVQAQYGFDASSSKVVNVATPTDSTDAANKAYVDSHANNISGGQQSGTFTATFDGPFAPSTKQTASGHYRKIGDLTHVTIHATNLNLTNYANEIRITGLPFKPDPDISGGNHIGKIHGVSFMVNNAHGDDGFVAVATHNATYGNHIVVFSEQVDQTTHYLNASPAKVTISITYIAE